MINENQARKRWPVKYDPNAWRESDTISAWQKAESGYRRRGYWIMKRLFDLTASLIGILLLSPLWLLIGVWIKLDSKGPIFFRQERVGRWGKPFLIYKFRTMVVEAERLGNRITIENDDRITRCGRFLRKYKLDEFPQLLNVMKGEMSLVGPRPQLPFFVKLYNEEQLRVLSVPPGLTDEASMKYRNEQALLPDAARAEQYYIDRIMPDKLRLSIRYIEQATMKKDLEILFKTLWLVCKKERVRQ